MSSSLLRTAALPLLPLALLCACSGSSDDPGAVTADEAAQLNDAAAMLDANSIDLNAAAAADEDATPAPATGNETDPR